VETVAVLVGVVVAIGLIGAGTWAVLRLRAVAAEPPERPEEEPSSVARERLQWQRGKAAPEPTAAPNPTTTTRAPSVGPDPRRSTARPLHSEDAIRADAILDQALGGDTVPPPAPRTSKSDPGIRGGPNRTGA
jgi:hypothetical protein